MRKIFKILILLSPLFLMVSNSYSQTLIDYVGKEDGCFNWELLSKEKIEGVSVYNIDLISQEWKNIVWTHRLVVSVPEILTNPDLGILFITGSWKGNQPEEVLYIQEMSRNLGCVAAALFDVPNQPLFDGLREDALIAYTLAKFVETNDEEWPLLLPMTKSAVKAMTAIQEFSKKEFGMSIDGFVVTGASKRGWTTWLTAACDERVKGIAPLVYDNLNIKAQFEHQRELWGDLSAQIHDYTDLGLDKLVDFPIGDSLLAIIDPYSYRDRIVVPKFIINGSNDPYWAIDAVNLYFEDLPGDKYILYVPNSGHELQDRERVIKSISTFYLCLAEHIPFPEISWNFTEDERSISLELFSDIEPTKAGVWYAESSNKNFVYSVWDYIEAQESELGYTVKLNKPQDKNLALFGELYYRIGDGELYLCTPSMLR